MRKRKFPHSLSFRSARTRNDSFIVCALKFTVVLEVFAPPNLRVSKMTNFFVGDKSANSVVLILSSFSGNQLSENPIH